MQESTPELEIETTERVEFELEDNPDVLLVWDPAAKLAWLERSDDDLIEPSVIYDNGEIQLGACVEFGTTLDEARLLSLLGRLGPI